MFYFMDAVQSILTYILFYNVSKNSKASEISNLFWRLSKRKLEYKLQTENNVVKI